MTKQEAQRREHMFRALATFGIDRREAEQLRRISMQLRSWHERLCNEDIEERDDGSAWFTFHGASKSHAWRIPNRGAGAERRLAAIMAPHRCHLCYYVQTDPRGAALYIVSRVQLRRAGKKPADLDSCYTIGTAVY